MDRRRFLGQAGLGIGMAALAELLQRDLFAQGAGSVLSSSPGSRIPSPGIEGLPHFAPKAKRVI